MFRRHLRSTFSRPNQKSLLSQYCFGTVDKAFAGPSQHRLFGTGFFSSCHKIEQYNRRRERLLREQKSYYSTSHPFISTNVVYQGPLSRAFRSLKIFSLTSLGLASALTPFMFVIDTSLPNIARVALAITAMSTSGISTALVGWCGQPYVTTIRTLGGISSVSQESAAKNGSGPQDVQSSTPPLEGIQLETLSLTLKPRFTSVYDTSFLTETKRPMAKWELAETVMVQKNSSETGSEGVPSEETVAETMDAQGRILGRWIVSWNQDGTNGVCRGEGKIQRYFNVHEEIIPPSIR